MEPAVIYSCSWLRACALLQRLVAVCFVGTIDATTFAESAANCTYITGIFTIFSHYWTLYACFECTASVCFAVFTLQTASDDRRQEPLPCI